MFSLYMLLVVSLMSILRDFHVSSCDESCADKPVFSPSRLVVKHGDPASATCTICQRGCNFTSPGIETSVGSHEINGSRILWTVDRMTEWDVIPTCYYEDADAKQCCNKLPITVYKPPDNVSITFVRHTGPMLEGRQYTLQCTVQNVAPVENLTVTFYKGRTQLGQTQIENNTQKKPTNVIKTLDVTVRKDDDRVQYWCRAKLELGPEGPQPPPVVTSQHITGTVYYAPQLMSVPHLEQITVKKGDPLQLNCSAVGNPRPSYTWTLPLAQPSSFSDSILTIDSVTSVNQGQYNCTVNNSVGTITVHFNVDVQDVPQLMSVPHLEQITVKKGDSLQLNCSAVGNPRPSYTWTLPLAQPSSFSDSVLTIDSVTSVNQGQYNCTVNNSVGTITVHFNVDVQDAPQLMSVPHLEQITVKEGDPLQLNCSAVGNPRPSYTWTLPLAQPSSFSDSILTIDSVTSVNQGQYNCTVSNSVGTITVHFNVDVQADYTVYIIVFAVVVVVLVAACVLLGFMYYYINHRMGQYNLKDVFRLHTRHVAVPAEE